MSGENKEVGRIDRRVWKVDGNGTIRMDMDLWLQLKSAEEDGDIGYRRRLLRRAARNNQGKIRSNNGKQNIETRPVKTESPDPPTGLELEPLPKDKHDRLYRSRELYRPIDARDLEPKRKQIFGNNLQIASLPEENPSPKIEKGKVWLMGTYVDMLD